MIPLVLVEPLAREGHGWEDQVNVGTLAVFIGLRPTTLMAQRWFINAKDLNFLHIRCPQYGGRAAKWSSASHTSPGT